MGFCTFGKMSDLRDYWTGKDTVSSRQIIGRDRDEFISRNSGSIWRIARYIYIYIYTLLASVIWPIQSLPFDMISCAWHLCKFTLRLTIECRSNAEPLNDIPVHGLNMVISRPCPLGVTIYHRPNLRMRTNRAVS